MSNLRPLDAGAMRSARAALALAAPILQEVIDADIISNSRIHHPGATEAEHLDSMAVDDREEAMQAIRARDMVRNALRALLSSEDVE